MDVNSLISNQKHCSGEGNDNSRTMICDLHDEILVLIISSLPAIQAIRTSVLSKRWINLWRRISKIELKEETPEKRQQFMDIVRRLLVACDCSILEKFTLSCNVGEDAPQFNEWLSGFINPKIRELNLDLKGIEEPLVFPSHLFTCATLTKFHISMQHILELPSPIRFESLKTLTLERVILPVDSSSQQLFSGLPSLQELSLINCNWMNVRAVCISSPSLRKLIIMESDDIGGQKVSNRCDVVIDGTDSLKSFTYDGVCTNDYFLYGSASVINASILAQVPESDEGWEIDAGYLVFKLLKALPNVKKLSISDMSLLAIGSRTSLLGYLPLFCNLAELCVVSMTRTLLSCEALLTILQHSHCLQVLNFEGGVSVPKFCADYTLDPLRMCFRTRLKTIKVDGFSGDKEELHTIKILLQAASVLDTLYICCYSFDFDSSTRSKRLKKLHKQILRFPKVSTDCKIDLVYKEGGPVHETLT